jgi:hypothetical protein
VEKTCINISAIIAIRELKGTLGKFFTLFGEFVILCARGTDQRSKTMEIKEADRTRKA